MKNLIQSLAHSLGFHISRHHNGLSLRDLAPESDLSDAEKSRIIQCSKFTMTGPQRLISLQSALNHIVEHGIEGAVVECGVWRGGSMMLVATTLLDRRMADRDLFLYDTFTGMSPPSDLDKDHEGTSAAHLLDATPAGHGVWCEAGLSEVRSNMLSTGYPGDRVHFVAGKVEDTIPEKAPEQIALLRLDTDWYESTKHELTHLYPRLSPGGILIIDDYGHWQGARQAVDEYFRPLGSPYLQRIDYTARLHVKPA